MGLFLFAKSTPAPVSAPALGPTQVEQRGHDSIKPGSDISVTLEQISNAHANSVDIRTVEEKTDDSVASFVSAKPNNLFIIDGNRDTQESIICTSNDTNGGKTCLKLKVSSIQLFKTMQKMEYFCSLPDDIDATYFECRKIK